MKKKNRSPINRKPKFIDGIDVKNIHCYSYEEMLEAEGKIIIQKFSLQCTNALQIISGDMNIS